METFQGPDMDFFDSQEKARRKSGVLVFLFFAATAGIVLTVYLLIFLLLLADAGSFLPAWDNFVAMVDLLSLLGLAILAVIGLGTFFKMHQLRSGGAAVAELLGGRIVSPDSQDPHERRVLNVVEEMAIASGLPVPPVYLLDNEQGINAFAAGVTPGNAVVGVTAGAVELLNRSELQAVLGHEFSHILNGDMRLNIRLMSVIHGLVILGLAGRVLLRMAFYGGGRSRDRKFPALPIFLGISLMIVGSLGMFFGSMIKAAVSRQREYLADAASVQFTRDAEAMAGVLKKIGALAQGSRLENLNAPQASHMFFAQGADVLMNALFATHPPLEERIRRIDSAWDGTFPALHTPPPVDEQSGTRSERAPTGVGSLTGSLDIEVSRPESLTGTIGLLDQAHIAHARQLRRRIPDQVMDAAHDPGRAHAVLFSLLMDERIEVAKVQGRVIREQYGLETQTDVERLVLFNLDRTLRLPLMDVCFPALRLMPFDRYQAFKAVVLGLIQADGRVGLFEWAVHRAVLRHLEPAFMAPPERAGTGHGSLRGLTKEASLILSALAHVGSFPEGPAAAFEQGAKRISQSGLEFRPREECGIQALDQALTRLNRMREKDKRELITACAAVVAADGKVNFSEAEVLRAVSDALECPMPPLLPGIHQES